MGEIRTAYNIWVVKPEGKKPLERPRCRLEGNINGSLRNMVLGCGVGSTG
jgi:hypothetical protein